MEHLLHKFSFSTYSTERQLLWVIDWSVGQNWSMFTIFLWWNLSIYKYIYIHTNIQTDGKEGGKKITSQIPPIRKMLALPLHSFFEDDTIAEWENPDKRDEAHSEDKILQNFRAVKPVWALFLKYIWEWSWSQRSDHIICLELLLRDPAVVKIETPFRRSWSSCTFLASVCMFFVRIYLS